MPVDYRKYPSYWKRLSAHIRHIRAKDRCEWCGAVNGERHPETGSKVVLTVAHLDHDTSNNRFSNLRALCQRCHLTYDAQFHADNAKVTRAAKKEQAREDAGQQRMF